MESGWPSSSVRPTADACFCGCGAARRLSATRMMPGGIPLQPEAGRGSPARSNARCRCRCRWLAAFMVSSNSRNGSHDQSSPTPRFVHTDVLSAYATGSSPSTPDAYIRALARQYPINSASDNLPRPAIAIADYGLHSAVKTALACDREGVDHLVALRVRVVAQRAYRTWGERTGELILL